MLDWELAGYGDPLSDVAEIVQWEGGEPCTAAQAEHPRDNLPRDPSTQHRPECYRARLCLDELAWGAPSTREWLTKGAKAVSAQAD